MKRLTAFLCLFLISCQGNSRADEPNRAEDLIVSALNCVAPSGSNQPERAPSRSAYQELKLHLEMFDERGDHSRPKEYQPMFVLERLHPWFKNGLCERKWNDQTVYVLATIPDHVIADINAAKGSDTKNGIGLLNPEFWTDIQRIQSEGLSVAFLEFSNQFEVSGVFSNGDKFIGIDVFANPGTPTHEFRHFLQHSLVPDPWRPRVLSPKCAEQAARYFGELDATTVQLPFWKNAFDGVETGALLEEKSPILRTYPQTAFLDANLGYPNLAAEWVSPSDCPKELISAINKISSRIAVFTSSVSKLASHLVGTHANVYHLLMEMSPECRHDRASDSIACQPYEQRLKRLLASAEALKSSLNEQIENEAKTRPLFIHEAIKTLPPKVHLDLEQVSGAYVLLWVGPQMSH